MDLSDQRSHYWQMKRLRLLAFVFVAAAPLPAGAWPWSKYGSQLEAQRACKRWMGDGSPSYNWLSDSKFKQPSKVKFVSRCILEQSTSQYLGITYESLVYPSDIKNYTPRTEGKVWRHFRF
ncbi:hypothetical protein [Synechococcus sp. LTW-R]|uniref:hypothetical protein n=1 Tax=Synechococcus sp. LTW-R TaxID=2751170 RepID=UPI0016296C6A|nr:hypothetical protein [Synechococcus sp. LTW-R]QNG29301.1 hypothetical protein H0O22_11335 [Synechococcus sp. LTW-R]